jgi:pimeloyl-ACP methyl ester carboxylesterase
VTRLSAAEEENRQRDSFGKYCEKNGLVRSDYSVASEPGINIFVRQVSLKNTGQSKKVPVLLLHGARVSGIASFDLPVPNGSLSAKLGRVRHTVYIIDARGYGNSTFGAG